MGYHVYLVGSNAVIRAKNISKADKAIRALNFDNSLKWAGRRGGDSKFEELKCSGQPHEDTWFGWMPWNYHDKSVCPDLGSILEWMQFDTHLHDGTKECCIWHYQEDLWPETKDGKQPKPKTCFYGAGTLSFDHFEGKIGSEHLLFRNALAPYIEATDPKKLPYMEWIGEDDAHWRWIFKDKKLYSQEARVVWDEGLVDHD